MLRIGRPTRETAYSQRNCMDRGDPTSHPNQNIDQKHFIVHIELVALIHLVGRLHFVNREWLRASNHRQHQFSWSRLRNSQCQVCRCQGFYNFLRRSLPFLRRVLLQEHCNALSDANMLRMLRCQEYFLDICGAFHFRRGHSATEEGKQRFQGKVILGAR